MDNTAYITAKRCKTDSVSQRWLVRDNQGTYELYDTTGTVGRWITLPAAWRDRALAAFAAKREEAAKAAARARPLLAIRQCVFEAQDATAEPTLDYFTCRGSVRGDCGHKHATYAAAQRCNERDQSGCASQGGYSDRVVVAVDSDGSTRTPSEAEAGL